MKPLAQPQDEYRRHDALLRYGMLDSNAEPAFDDLLQLATQICGAPVASSFRKSGKRYGSISSWTPNSAPGLPQ